MSDSTPTAAAAVDGWSPDGDLDRSDRVLDCALAVCPFQCRWARANSSSCSEPGVCACEPRVDGWWQLRCDPRFLAYERQLLRCRIDHLAGLLDYLAEQLFEMKQTVTKDE